MYGTKLYVSINSSKKLKLMRKVIQYTSTLLLAEDSATPVIESILEDIHVQTIELTIRSSETVEQEQMEGSDQGRRDGREAIEVAPSKLVLNFERVDLQKLKVEKEDMLKNLEETNSVAWELLNVIEIKSLFDTCLFRQLSFFFSHFYLFSKEKDVNLSSNQRA